MFLLSAKFLFIDLCLVWRFVVGTFPVECDPGILTVVDLSNGSYSREVPQKLYDGTVSI